MAVSGTISTTTFNTRRVIDTAFRRCRLPAQAVTAEMQSYAQDALYLQLSELANGKTPSWCIEKLVLPFQLNRAQVTLPVGTVEVLNANIRNATTLEPTVTVNTMVEYRADLTTATQVTILGVAWAAAAVALTVDVSDDELVWVTVANIAASSAVAGDLTWNDIVAPAARYLRITGTGIDAEFTLQTLGQEIPLGQLNRDTYAALPNKAFTSNQPTNYWFQRQREEPLMFLWPTPNTAALSKQLIVWRHRHIMDVGTLQQEIEVPQRWMDAIIDGLAARMAIETPGVDMSLIPSLEMRAAQRLQVARDGDNDGSSTYIQPQIACYTA